MSSSETQIMEHLEYLSDKIGPRPAGSDGNRAAADYIQRAFNDCGLEVEMQEYACPAWECTETLLEVDGEKQAAGANAFSRPCDVTASTVAIGTVAELETAALDGLIAILYGDLTKSPIAAKSWFVPHERDEHIVQLLEEKRPAALITVKTSKGELERVIEDWELSIPSATVPARVGLLLLKKRNPMVHLRIKSQQVPGKASNVVALKTGDHPERIVLCAHYDTKIDTPGAIDNASGAAVLLGLAQKLSSRKLTHGLEYVAFTGEEYLPPGDDEYIRREGDQLGKILAAINIDGVGQTLETNTITMIACSQPFHEQVEKLTRAYPGVVWVDPWPESNHSTFSWRGVPSLAFSSGGAFALAHLRIDTSDWISPDKLNEVVSLIADIVESLQDKTTYWTREPRPEYAPG